VSRNLISKKDNGLSDLCRSSSDVRSLGLLRFPSGWHNRCESITLGAQWNRSWRNTVQIDCGHSPFWHEGAKSRSYNAYTSEPYPHKHIAHTRTMHSRDILELSEARV